MGGGVEGLAFGAGAGVAWWGGVWRGVCVCVCVARVCVAECAHMHVSVFVV